MTLLKKQQNEKTQTNLEDGIEIPQRHVVKQKSRSSFADDDGWMEEMTDKRQNRIVLDEKLNFGWKR